MNDIALLELKTAARRRQNIDAVCMPKRNDFKAGSKAKCYVTGWGRKDESEYIVSSNVYIYPFNYLIDSRYVPSVSSTI